MEDVLDKDIPPPPTEDEAAAAAAASSAPDAAAQSSSATKAPADTAKEVLEERISLYKIDIDESELNLRRNTILGMRI